MRSLISRRPARWALAGAALSLMACSASVAEERAARPALWKVADEDTTIYLFGTIHALPEGLNWRTPAIERAISSSDTLVLEVLQGDDPMAAAQAMMKIATSPGLPPLVERVPPEKREALAKAVAASGLPATALDKLETWAVAITFLSLSMKDLGIETERGGEKVLLSAYKSDGKKLDALETVDQQLGFFDTLSEEAQRLILVSTLDDPDATRTQFQGMLDAWAKGDVDAIARTFDEETSLSPELRTVLMKHRNARWAEWVSKRLDQPGTVMVAVGAGHLAGSDSLQKMLEGKGLQAERVQ